MPDFVAFWNRSEQREVITSRLWVDPPHGALPGRLNPEPARQPRYAVWPAGDQIELYLTLPGEAGVLHDDDLDGRLFSVDFIETPGEIPVLSNPIAERSGLVVFTPTLPGHYTMICRREGSGAVILHLEVE